MPYCLTGGLLALRTKLRIMENIQVRHCTVEFVHIKPKQIKVKFLDAGMNYAVIYARSQNRFKDLQRHNALQSLFVAAVDERYM